MLPTTIGPIDENQGCEMTPKGWCHAAGDPHYISYDGTKFDFMGTCRYLLTGVDENRNRSDSLPGFRVEVGHRRAWNSKVSMTEDVWITFDHSMNNETTAYAIYLHIADRPQGQGKRVKLFASN